MRKLERLRKEALESCKFHGHKMKPFSRKYRYWWDSECKVCGMRVNLNAEPYPDAIEIRGDAITLHCGR